MIQPGKPGKSQGLREETELLPKHLGATWGQEGQKGAIPCFACISELSSSNKQSKISGV